MEKRCSKCKVVKELSAFHSNKAHKQGVGNQCKLCTYESTAEYRRIELSARIIKPIESLPNEQWEWVEYEGERFHYKVSTLGRLASYKLIQPYIMSTTEDKRSRRGGRPGYEMCRLRSVNNKKYYSTRIHRLMALAFLPNPNNLAQVNHKDGDKSNNVIENLEWVSSKENINHAFKMGVVPRKSGVESHTYDKGRKILHKPSNSVYNSIAQAARDLGVPRTSVNGCLRGNRPNKYQVFYID